MGTAWYILFTMEKLPFCVLPWIHSYVDGEGNRSLCCIAKPYKDQERVNSLTLEEYGNWLGKIRNEMLSGVVPDVCSNCVTFSSININVKVGIYIESPLSVLKR